MAAFFFPNETKIAPEDVQGNCWIDGKFVSRFWHRQAVDPLDLAALLADSRATAAFVGTFAKWENAPERYFCRYHRYDGSQFIVGTVKRSKFSLP